MFLCDTAKEKVFTEKPTEQRRWEEFGEKKKQYTWPDRTILFDTLEKIFMDAGYNTALMYLHNSPGLVRVKRLATEKSEDTGAARLSPKPRGRDLGKCDRQNSYF